MNVEVDADELCELRQKANNYDNSYFIGQSFAGAVIYSSDHDAVIKEMVDVNEKLTKERDWWRKAALLMAEHLNRRRESVINMANNWIHDWNEELKEDAANIGYSVD